MIEVCYVVVYCDKEEKGLHTDFRLESGKDGSVYLFKGDEIVDKVEGMMSIEKVEKRVVRTKLIIRGTTR